MVVVDFRITTAGAALAAIVCGGGAVVISPKTVEARPVLEHASCVSAGGFTPSPSAWLSLGRLPPGRAFLRFTKFSQIVLLLGWVSSSKSARPVVGLFLGKRGRGTNIKYRRVRAGRRSYGWRWTNGHPGLGASGLCGTASAFARASLGSTRSALTVRSFVTPIPVSRAFYAVPLD